MNSYIWTQIQPSGALPQGRGRSSLTAVSDTQLLLHGGDGGRFLNDTWILNLPSQTWKQHVSNMALPRYGHTGSVGLNNSIAIICGQAKYKLGAWMVRSTCTFDLMLEPKTLQQLAMKKIYSHRFEVQWRHLPKQLISKLGLSDDEILKEGTARVADDKSEMYQTSSESKRARSDEEMYQTSNESKRARSDDTQWDGAPTLFKTVKGEGNKDTHIVSELLPGNNAQAAKWRNYSSILDLRVHLLEKKNRIARKLREFNKK